MPKIKTLEDYKTANKNYCKTYYNKKKNNLNNLKEELTTLKLENAKIKQENSVKLLNTFHEQMRLKYDLIQKRDATFLNDNELLVELKDLWPGLSEESKQTLWEYLDILIQHATCYNMYDKIPQGLRGTIGNITKSIETSNAADVNLAQVSAQLLSNVDPEEMKAFAIGMMQDKEGLEDMLRVATSHWSWWFKNKCANDFCEVLFR